MRRAYCKVKLPGKYVASRGRSAPKWAIDIVRKECREEYECWLCWTWQTTPNRRNDVSGRAERGKLVTHYGTTTRLRGAVITITAGDATSQRHQLAVLLHEIAHHTVGLDAKHTKPFCKEVVRLYAKYNLLDEVLGWYCYASEQRAVERAIAKRDKRKATQPETPDNSYDGLLAEEGVSECCGARLIDETVCSRCHDHAVAVPA